MNADMMRTMIVEQRREEVKKLLKVSREQRRKVKKLLKVRRPSITQTSVDSPVNQKALDLMGDSFLERASAKALPVEAEGKDNVKAAKLLGTMNASGNHKIRQRMGSFMTTEQTVAMHENIRKEAAERAQEAERQKAEVLRQRLPSQDQRKLGAPVNSKVLDMMGDSFLEHASAQAVPVAADGKDNLKAAKVMGNINVSGNAKIRQRMGSFMHDDQMLAMRDADKKEEADRVKEAERLKAELLRQRSPSKAQKKVDAPVNSKVLDMMGDSFLERESVKAVPVTVAGKDNLKAAKMMGNINVSGNAKIRQRMGSFMHDDQLLAMRNAAKKEEADRVKQVEAKTAEVLAKKAPVESQTRLTGRAQVKSKALLMMGSSFLDAQNSKQIGENTVVNAKLMKMMGEEVAVASAGDKARILLGLGTLIRSAEWGAGCVRGVGGGGHNRKCIGAAPGVD